MTTISLSTTTALLDLLPGRTSGRKASGLAATIVAPAPSLVEVVPLHLRLLPKTLRDAIVRRIRERELENAFQRLAETSPHLLADIGMEARSVAAGATLATGWSRGVTALEDRPVPAAPARPATPAAVRRTRRRSLDLSDHLRADIGLSHPQGMMETCRPHWNAPDHWLR